MSGGASGRSVVRHLFACVVGLQQRVSQHLTRALVGDSLHAQPGATSGLAAAQGEKAGSMTHRERERLQLVYRALLTRQLLVEGHILRGGARQLSLRGLTLRSPRCCCSSGGGVGGSIARASAVAERRRSVSSWNCNALTSSWAARTFCAHRHTRAGGQDERPRPARRSTSSFCRRNSSSFFRNWSWTLGPCAAAAITGGPPTRRG
jgi:hypothetical protein